MERVWTLSQDPVLHPRWDLRFSKIVPAGSDEQGLVRFRYEFRLPFHSIQGAGTSLGPQASIRWPGHIGAEVRHCRPAFAHRPRFRLLAVHSHRRRTSVHHRVQLPAGDAGGRKTSGLLDDSASRGLGNSHQFRPPAAVGGVGSRPQGLPRPLAHRRRRTGGRHSGGRPPASPGCYWAGCGRAGLGHDGDRGFVHFSRTLVCAQSRAVSAERP